MPSPSSRLPPPSFGPPDHGRAQPAARRPGRDRPPAAGGSGPDGRVLLTVFAVILAAGVLAHRVRGLAPRPARRAWARTGRGGRWSARRSASGFGPRPTQTVYEYASALGDLVPVAKRDIDTVATAKVETSYAGAKLAGSRLDEVRAATRRLRISLLRLVFRRPRRRRRS